MIYLHCLAAVLATWRITELFTQDRIMDRLRKRFPTYLWQCPRCMSIWAGMWSALMIILGPITHSWSLWSLWPFALGWVYLAHLDSTLSKRLAKDGRRFVVESRGQQWTLTRNDFTPQETHEMLGRVLSAMFPPSSGPVTSSGAQGYVSDTAGRTTAVTDSQAQMPAPEHVNGVAV